MDSESEPIKPESMYFHRERHVVIETTVQPVCLLARTHSWFHVSAALVGFSKHNKIREDIDLYK